LITPLQQDESLDEAGLERLVEHVVAGGVAGIFVLGSSGEGPSLSEQTKERVVRATVRFVRGRVPVLVGALAAGTRQTIDLAKRLVQQGGDAVVIVPPFYFAHTQDEIVAHVTAVAAEQDAPVIMYNIPQMVKTVIEPDTVGRLLQLPRGVGIKDSLGDMTRFQRLLEQRTQRRDFGVYQGAEGVVAVSVIRGADGVVLGLANVAPRLCCSLFDAARGGDLGQAWHLQEQLMTLWQLHSHGQWLPCLKTALSHLGLCSPVTSAPFSLPGEQATAAILQDMRAAGVVAS
jgi:4-hydroxy-tetrahydrodipicolinate synthase